MRWLIPGFVVAITFAACDSKDNLLSVKDGAADTPNGTGGGLGGAGVGGTSGQGGATGRGGATAVGTGGAPSGGINGSGGIVGSGGLSSTGVTGRGGSGGAAGISGTGGLGTGGSGGSTRSDGAIADAANDAASRADGGDAVVECAPGYPVGSSMSDGCNTCVCMAGGAFACTTHVCPPDAAPDAPADGPTPDGAALDTSAVACSALTTEADCRARSDCHPLFYDPATCGCATLGCCAAFSKCADGKADCEVPTQFSCTIAQPYCEGPYVVAYRAGCFEGCVLGTDCSGLSSCSPAPVCGADEVSVRVQRPATGEVQCACEPNPCPGLSIPTCDCAAELCTKYPGVSCVGYMPGSGQLVCAEDG